MGRYAYFSSENNKIEYVDDIKELIEYFYKILNKDNLKNPEVMDDSFYHNIENDGYYIIQIVDVDITHFYLDLDRKNDIYNDLKNEEEIFEMLKNKIYLPFKK